LVADMPTGTVDALHPLHYELLLRSPWGDLPPPVMVRSPRPGSTLPRRGPTPPVDGETARALCRRLLVVPVAVSLVLLTTVRPTGGHAGLLEEDFTDATSAHELKKLLHLAGRDRRVFAGPLEDRVAEGHHGVAQAGHQGPRGVTAELPGVASNNPRQPLGDAIRRHVVQSVESCVVDVAVLHGV